ncbi:unnamed protein product [Discosporangium mesarthrocarpum]
MGEGEEGDGAAQPEDEESLANAGGPKMPRKGRGKYGLSEEEEAEAADVVNQIDLIVGLPFTVTLDALTRESQAIIRDAMVMYASMTGVELAKRVIVRLHD